MDDALVSTQWLADHLTAPDIRIVDATWFLPGVDRDPRAEYEAAHIPGAVFFDIDDIAEDTSPLPHMVPSAEKFSSRVRKLGLGDGVRIVVYDNNRFSASARVWWMFRLFGHDDVAVLDGGLAKWRDEGRPIDDMPVRPTERHFTARTNNLLLRDLGQMRRSVTSKRELVLDTRSRGRFTASDPEPRPGLRGGHMPGSRNLPASELVAADGTLREPGELRRLLDQAEIEYDKPLVTSCGSGVSAPVLNLALYVLGLRDAAVYDGSWTEWGAQSDTPVVR